jgi:hypothetical protein
MRKFILKLILFLSPFFLALGVQLFVLPIDFFCFRAVEALVVRKFKNILPGQFYSNMNLIKEEEGDLGHHTKYALRRTVQWITDSYGYRKEGSNRLKYEVVIIGQSETFGSGLTQKEMLSEVLEGRLRLGVYPFAPASVNAFLKEERFILHPPEIVILSSMERAISLLPPLKISSRKIWVPYETVRNTIRKMRNNPWIQSFGVFLDRLYKMDMVRYIRASIRRGFSNRKENDLNRVDSKFGPILFLQGANANKSVPEGKLNEAVQTIKGYHDLFKSKGIRFIFLATPEKETIFYQSLGTPRPVFLEQLTARLEQLGVEIVCTQQAFENAFEKESILLYLRDDTHWNATAVRIAADLLTKVIQKKDEAVPHS